MKLYLINAENIYFPQIKAYFREIVSSYDNGNYRSAVVMLYSTVVCDLLLKLKELSDVYSDEKAEKILEEINKQRKGANSSAWEWNLIKKIREQTELLNDESYAMIEHIYTLRNFSAHPAMNEDYELISPTPEMTVAYIKKALEDILCKPSVFAQNIVDRMSDDVASKKDIYKHDIEAFDSYLNKVYFERMSDKMMYQVFKAFWKFTFTKTGEIFAENRYINSKVLEALLDRQYDSICNYIKGNQQYFTVSQDSSCLEYLCILLAVFPHVYQLLNNETKYQIVNFDKRGAKVLKWFIRGNLEQHIESLKGATFTVKAKGYPFMKKICEKQGQPKLFTRFLIDYYAKSNSYSEAKTRFDEAIEPHLSLFEVDNFVEIIGVINSNNQIYNYALQRARNDILLKAALPLLPKEFDLKEYEHFKYTATEATQDSTDTSNATSEETSATEPAFEGIEDLPF